jgi:succinylarginine dihydrolase
VTVRFLISISSIETSVVLNYLTVSTPFSDTNNLKNLLSKRINLAIIDKNVMSFLFKTNPSLNKRVQFAQFNSQLLEERSYSFVLVVQEKCTKDHEGIKTTSTLPLTVYKIILH